MNAEKPQQFVIYSRKSKFTGKGESVENQVEMCRQYIAAHYSAEEAKKALVYEDEGFSGGTLERPQFKKMMAEARQKHFGAIVVYRLDRISRNIGDFAKLIEQLADMKIDFISIKEQFDTVSPMGRAMMYISSVFSQLERETIAERIRDNMHELSKTGRWLGGITPLGYTSESVSKITVDGKTKRACQLKMVPEEMEVVKLIFDQFLETGSLTGTDAYLLEKRYVTRRGNRFTRFTIRNILSNPVYMIADENAYHYLTDHRVNLFADLCDFDCNHGIMAYNRTLQRPGKTNQIRPMEEWIVSVGRHPGIIPGTKWIQVQKLLQLNRSKSYRKPRSNTALLSGLLFCGKCGDCMRPKQTPRKNAAGDFIYTYLCTTKERSHGHCCAVKNANGNAIDEAILKEIKKLGYNASEFVRQLEMRKKLLVSDRNDHNIEINALEAQIDACENEIKGLVKTLPQASSSAAQSYILEQIDALHEKLEAFKKRIEDLNVAAARPELSASEFEAVRKRLSSFDWTIDNLSVAHKRAAVRTFVCKVIWDGKNAHVYLMSDEGGFRSSGQYGSFPKNPSGEDSK